jgi:hypothetical protein
MTRAEIAWGATLGFAVALALGELLDWGFWLRQPFVTAAVFVGFAVARRRSVHHGLAASSKEKTP